TLINNKQTFSLTSMVMTKDAELEMWLEARIELAKMLSEMKVIQDACRGSRYAEAKAVMERLFKGSENYENLFIANPDGLLFVMAAGDAQALNINISQIPVYQKNVEEARKGNIWISDVGKSQVSGRPVALITAPVMENGQLIGIVGAPVELNAYSDLAISNVKVGETGYFIITDKEGVILAHPDKKNIFNLNVKDVGLADMLKQKEGSYAYTFKGDKKILAFKQFKRTGWYVAATQFEDEFLKDVRALARLAIIMAVLGIVLVIGIITFVTGLVTKILDRTVERLHDIAEGEADLTQRIHYVSKDEVGQVVKWFNVFVERMQNLVHDVMEAAHHVKDASDQISASAEQLAAGAEEQQAQLSEVATSIEQMSAVILDTARNTGETQEFAHSADSAAKHGRATVEESTTGIDRVVAIIQSAAAQVASLEHRSQEIGEVIQVIDEIADQTNLLALNANIEAARAGDAGRGFAVVADEVRKLAERTVKATAEIGDKIKQIQNDIKGSVDAMTKVGEESSTSQKVAIQGGEALRQIEDIVAKLSQMISQIAAATEEQSTGAEEISRNVESVSTVSKEAASASQELASSAEELNGQMRSLQDLVSMFKV
ncbi:MAG TPA: methyl-accepting chemotaxis protein, partial [Candidatus Marinimicrobia bacterium]|nr:methyl-accepting chemotaxis protein [Candidatus Neomarinimicrobiota bacterium]